MDLQELENLLASDDPQVGLQLRQDLLGDVRLGSLLVRIGLLDADSLDSALHVQQQTGELLGETLIDLGLCTEDQISWALGAQYAETRLGQLLLRSGTMSIDQLRQAYDSLRDQPGSSLPELLVQAGFVGEERLLALMAVQYQEAKLGQILLVTRSITEGQLAEGLERQGHTGEQLGEALRALGYCNDEQIAHALQFQAKS